MCTYAEFEALKTKVGCKTNKEVGDLIGAAPSTISNWKKEDHVPKMALLALQTFCPLLDERASALARVSIFYERTQKSYDIVRTFMTIDDREYPLDKQLADDIATHLTTL